MEKLNTLIHQPVRLQIMAALAALKAEEQMEFVYLRNLFNLTDGNLGAHLLRLEEEGYIRVEKTFVKRKPCSHIQITARGKEAFDEHVKVLKQIVKGHTL
ncbi:MAG: transcriptional regulator [Sedimentisphaerales bacterium]|nr:transcriptional regulator [Sedimentisphaerales bacterium]